MTRKILLLLSALFITFANIYAQQIIAHRGYWKADGSAQNSIVALKKADEIKVYGSEVDIWLSSDGVPVVNHDRDIIIDGQSYVIEDTPLSTLRKAKLSNGEVLPTFEEYLDAFEDCKNIKLIVEFKTHDVAERENILAKKVIEMVNERKLQDRVEYISFGLNFIFQIRNLAPESPVYYLTGEIAPQNLAKLGVGLDYNFNVFKRQPNWVKDAQNRGVKVNTWTVNNPEDIQAMIDLNVDFITTDEPLLVRSIMNKE